MAPVPKGYGGVDGRVDAPGRRYIVTGERGREGDSA